MYYLVYFLTQTATPLTRVLGAGLAAADLGGDVHGDGGHGGPLPA